MQLINERKLRAAICRKSFWEFVKMFWPIVVAEDLIPNWHIHYLCNEVQKVAERVFAGLPKEYDLVINISPGSTKSTIISQLLPAWCWTRMPSFRSINGSYSYDLSLAQSIACRDVVESQLYQEMFPGIVLREDQNTKGLFRNTLKGGRLSTSVGSRITGFHGHLLTMDDPMDPEQALSEADLKKINRWMTNTLPSRGIMRTDTPLILVMQRLAQNDPAGERISRGGRLKHICIPAELIYDKEGKLAVYVNPPELVKYYREGLMDPRRLTRQNLTEFHKTLGEYGYSGQYLQDPVPLGGAMFDVTKIKIEQEAPRMVRLVRGWDKAATKDGGAFSVGVLMGLDKEGDYWVLDVQRGQWTPTDRERVIQNTAALDARGAFAKLVGVQGFTTRVEIILEKEGGSGGVESTENSIRALKGFVVTGKRVTGDKEARAWAFASQVGIQDHVHVLNREWTAPYLEELRYFPHGKYKDQVDGSSLSFNRIAQPKKIIGAYALNENRK